MPAIVALQETVAVPEPETLAGVNAPQLRPEGTVSVRVTTPEKWFRPVMIMVWLVDWPASMMLGEVELMVKSWTIKNATAV